MEPIALDVHAHLIPVNEERLTTIDGVSWAGERMVIDGHRVGLARLFQPDALLSWMQANAVEHAWISAPPPSYRLHLTGNSAEQWCDYLNQGLSEIAAAHPDKLSALPHLPTQDPALAASIVEHWSAAGVTTFAMPTGTGDERALSDAAFEVVWDALGTAEATVFMHPGSCADGRLQAYYLHNLLGNPVETAVAISHLVLGGVLERHPKMRCVFAHGGGAYPMVAGRLQRGFDTSRPDMKLDAKPPEAMASRIFADCICHGRAAFDLAEQTFGTSNILFGSDWPFPMGISEPQAQLSTLSTEQRRRVLQSNLTPFLSRMEIDHER